MIESISPGPFHITNEGSAYLVGTIIVDQSGANEIGCAWKESDARLFAAAPDLLEALQALGSMPDGYCFCLNQEQIKNGHTGECRQANAAITKALNTKGN